MLSKGYILGSACIYQAIDGGNIDTVYFIWRLENMTEFDNRNRLSAAVRAFESESKEIVEFVLSHGVSVDDMSTPLRRYRIRVRDPEFVLFLVRRVGVALDSEMVKGLIENKSSKL